MKKIVALFLTLALLISAAALPALAEGETETTGQTVSETRQTGRSGPGGQQPPAMPGNGQNGQGGPNGQQPPAMPGGGQNDQGGPSGQQPPAMPDGEQSSQDTQSGQQPGNEETDRSSRDGRQPKGKPGKKDRGGRSTPDGEPEKQLDFEQLVKDNVISQDVCDAILAYMKEHAPQDQSRETGTTEESESQDQRGTEPPARGSEPPAKPEGTQDAPGGMEEQLLKELLDGGVITQEVYDLLLSRLTTAESTTDTTAVDTTAADA